jgi:uncharacterized glyoxalase superfamily protein PhnB
MAKDEAFIQPRLVVKDAPRALEFYTKAFGAKEMMRLADPNLKGMIVHAELSFGEATVSLTEENKQWQSSSPKTLGGTPVALTLTVGDPDAVAARATKLGAEVVFPIQDQFYGYREGRIRDPFGHEWILSKQLEKLSVKEMEKRMAEWWKTQK